MKHSHHRTNCLICDLKTPDGKSPVSRRHAMLLWVCTPVCNNRHITQGRPAILVWLNSILLFATTIYPLDGKNTLNEWWQFGSSISSLPFPHMNTLSRLFLGWLSGCMVDSFLSLSLSLSHSLSLFSTLYCVEPGCCPTVQSHHLNSQIRRRSFFTCNNTNTTSGIGKKSFVPIERDGGWHNRNQNKALHETRYFNDQLFLIEPENFFFID